MLRKLINFTYTNQESESVSHKSKEQRTDISAK